MYPKLNFYILEVRDREDDYLYLTLVFTEESKLREAKFAISEFDFLWYTSTRWTTSDSYYDELVKYLDDRGFFEYEAIFETSYIR